MQHSQSVKTGHVVVKCISIYALVIGLMLPVVSHANDQNAGGHHKVLTTKECLLFLENETGEALSAHLLPNSYARCLALTRKALRVKNSEMDSAINQAEASVDPDSITDKARGAIGQVIPQTQPSNTIVPKKYYRVQGATKRQEVEK